MLAKSLRSQWSTAKRGCQTGARTMRLATHDLPRIVSCAELTANHIGVPRAGGGAVSSQISDEDYLSFSAIKPISLAASST
jgi:hypothetical protein